MKIFIIGSILVAPLLAKTTPPKVPIELEAEYYRADASVSRMKAAWDAANVDLQTAIAAVQKACGDKSVPQSSADGKHLVCVPKPEPPPEPKK